VSAGDKEPYVALKEGRNRDAVDAGFDAAGVPTAALL
jgi:hypothetical protein